MTERLQVDMKHSISFLCEPDDKYDVCLRFNGGMFVLLAFTFCALMDMNPSLSRLQSIHTPISKISKVRPDLPRPVLSNRVCQSHHYACQSTEGYTNIALYQAESAVVKCFISQYGV